MSNTLTFYSVSKVQVDRLLEHLGLTPDEEGMVSGETPLGKLTCQVAYVEPSGQLSVTVIDKPMFLTFATIEAHVKDALVIEPADALALPPTAPSAASGTPGKRVVG